MQIVIDIPEQMYLNAKADMLCGADILVKAIKNGIPHETVTEFADRCRECGAKYGKLLEKVPKTGRWIGHREHCENLGVMPSGLGAYEWCSNCDCGIDVREWHRNNYNYCPNCGARMVEQEGSEKE